MRPTRYASVVVALLLCLAQSPGARGAEEEQTTAKRAYYSVLAGVANVVPGVSALYAPTCLPGYIVCKLSFAAVSVVAAADQLLLAGWNHTDQTRAILYRGFAGDWVLTSRHVSGEAKAEPFPNPPAPVQSGDGEWTPPPL